MKKCENCKYEDVWIFDDPCRRCDVYLNDKWEPKNEEEVIG